MGFTGRRLIANSNISMRDLLKPGWLSGWERKIFAETFTFSEKISHVMFPELLIHYAGTLLELCFSFGERKIFLHISSHPSLIYWLSSMKHQKSVHLFTDFPCGRQHANHQYWYINCSIDVFWGNSKRASCFHHENFIFLHKELSSLRNSVWVSTTPPQDRAPALLEGWSLEKQA